MSCNYYIEIQFIGKFNDLYSPDHAARLMNCRGLGNELLRSLFCSVEFRFWSWDCMLRGIRSPPVREDCVLRGIRVDTSMGVMFKISLIVSTNY